MFPLLFFKSKHFIHASSANLMWLAKILVKSAVSGQIVWTDSPQTWTIHLTCILQVLAMKTLMCFLYHLWIWLVNHKEISRLAKPQVWKILCEPSSVVNRESTHGEPKWNHYPWQKESAVSIWSSSKLWAMHWISIGPEQTDSVLVLHSNTDFWSKNLT